MKSNHRTRKAASAETIARLADRGGDVSQFFTNKGQMMSPIQRVNLNPHLRKKRGKIEVAKIIPS